MKFLTLDYIKQHSRINFACEDSVLELYGDSAEETLAGLLNRGKTVEQMVRSFQEEYGQVPAKCYHAALMLVEQAYNHRGPTSPNHMSYVPYGFDLLIKPFMRLTSEPCGIPQQTVTLGSQEKILITANLPDGLTMFDVDFTVEVVNVDAKDKKKTFKKAECILTDEGDYVVLIDTADFGVGTLMCKVTFQIPDQDFPGGYRKTVVNINPHITIRG